MLPSRKFCKFVVSLKWHFMHFDIIFVVFYKVFILITDIFGLFFAVVNPSFQNQTLRSQNKQFLPCFQNFMINRENLIKIGRAGSNTSNRETPDQIGRVGISDLADLFVLSRSLRFARCFACSSQLLQELLPSVDVLFAALYFFPLF